jgi:hypothetical protein
MCAQYPDCMARRLLIAAVLLAALPATAAARPRDLWTTVNSCNVPTHPNKMGVRGRMPGDGTRGKMYMRFTAQFQDTDGSWKDVGGTGRSSWIYAGSALFTHEEAGFTFSFDPPQAGDRFLFRGVTDFEWRARRHRNGKVRTVVVERERKVTVSGHPSSGAEPPGYSAASCEMDGPGS